MLQKIPNSGKIIFIEPELILLAIAHFRLNLNSYLLDKTIEEYKEILNFFGGLTFRERGTKEPIFYQVKAPDVCLCCYSSLGSTIGGRVRIGCFNCRTYSYELADKFNLFVADSGLNRTEAEFKLATIIEELF